MSGTVATIGLSTDEFALHSTLQELNSIEFKIERVVAYDPDRVMPLVWVTGNDAETIESALQTDPSVENLELLTDLDNEQLYQMDWVEQIDTLIEILLEEDGTILDAFGDNTG